MQIPRANFRGALFKSQAAGYVSTYTVAQKKHTYTHMYTHRSIGHYVLEYSLRIFEDIGIA